MKLITETTEDIQYIRREKTVRETFSSKVSFLQSDLKNNNRSYPKEIMQKR